jgi:hypothetical protein
MTLEEFMAKERARLEDFGSEMATAAAKVKMAPRLLESQWGLLFHGQTILSLDLSDIGLAFLQEGEA